MEPTIQQPEPPFPKQFSLKRLFAAITVAGLIFGTVHWIGIAAAALIVGGVAAGYVLPRSRSNKVPLAVAGFLVGSLLTAIFSPAISHPRTPVRRSQCNNNLKQIGLGLQTYADNNSFFPADFTAFGGKSE